MSECLSERSLASACSVQDLQQAVLPVLVRLLGEAGLGEDVPGALCQLVQGSDELQQAAADADAIAKLAAILKYAQATCWQRMMPASTYRCIWL
jgi:hypothetical protein